MNPEMTNLAIDRREVASLAWCFCPDEGSVIEALGTSFALNNYKQLKAAGYLPDFPAAVILSLDVVFESRRLGYGRRLLRIVLSQIERRGAKTVLAKIAYDSEEDWEAELEWKERFYASEGFTVYADDKICPLMSLRFD
jgi:GNAT superfamily N-acetyltransferase